jgi:uncharacterized protein
MTDAPVISVRGEARLEVEPEIARISVYVQAQDADRATTLSELVARNERCLELVRSYGDAVEKLETGALTVTPLLRYRRREGDIRGYQGTVWIKVTVADFAVLGELVTRLADLERTRVDGPEWALRPGSEVYARAARQAAHEAIARARSYADALGCRLTGLLELADEGLGGRPGTLEMAAPMGAAFAAGGAEAEPAPINLEPEFQTVLAVVEARFTASPPDLS